MILDFNFPFKGLDGLEIPNSNAGKMIANSLAGSAKGDPLKLWTMAVKLHEGVELDLDPSDTQLLKTFIETNESFTILAKAQCLSVFK